MGGLTTAVVITRDRVGYTTQCVQALMGSPGIGDIHLVDHGSTYPPMLDMLAGVAGSYWAGPMGRESLKGRIHVHWKPNTHPRDLWTNGTLESIVKPGERFVVTDHDVVAPEGDWLAVLHQVLDARPDLVKAGLGLKVSDLPDTELAARVCEWEANYRRPTQLRRLLGVSTWYFEASVDTTLALYRRLEPYALDPAARLAHIEATHLPWYEQGEPDAEARWYREHAEHGHWRAPDGFNDEHGLRQT